jgi:hypothetical protein
VAAADADRRHVGERTQDGDELRSLGAAERCQETHLRLGHDWLELCEPSGSVPGHGDGVAAAGADGVSERQRVLTVM